MSAIPDFTVKVDSRKRVRCIRVRQLTYPFCSSEWLYIDDIVSFAARNWCDFQAALAKYVPEGHELVEVEIVGY